MDQITWQDNRALMGELWPKWRLEPSLSRLIDRKWGQLHQDKLRDCIEQHRLERDSSPDISAIHKQYCKITGGQWNEDAQREVSRTRAEFVQGPSQQELAEWDEDAKRILATATPQEIAAAKERLGMHPKQPRIVALMVEWCRQNPVDRAY